MPEQAGTGQAGSRKRKPRELTPVQSALALLVRREHSHAELVRKLAVRGVERGQAEAALQRLACEGWQSDARFGEMLVRTRAARGYGPVRIRAELGTHGLGAEVIEEALATFHGDWLAVATDLLQRRFSGQRGQGLAQHRKAADFLYRRGFDGDTVRLALKAVSGD